MSSKKSGEPKTTDGDDEDTVQTDVITQAVSPSSDYKTRGKIAADPGTGILGYNTSTSGNAYGVEGTTDSTKFEAAGVRGQSASGHGMWAYSEAVNGIRAITNAPGYGGIFASHLSGSGVAPAVIGRNSSSDYAAIEADNTGGGSGVLAKGDPAIDAEGDVNISNVGVSAYLSSNVSSFTGGTIPYDTVVADDRSEFDPGTGKVTLDTDGDFHVVANVDYGSELSEGDAMGLEIVVDSSKKAESYKGVTAGAAGYGPTISVTKTLRNLTSGQTIEINAFIQSSNDPTLTGGESLTYFTVSKIG